MRKSRKPLLVGIALALVAALGVGATLAWLTDKTDEVENTFTVGDINIELTETGATNSDGDKVWEKEFKMIPGAPLDKDPKVTVEANSEDCYVFVEVEESDNFNSFMTYEINDADWTQLVGYDGVFCREVGSSSADQAFKVLKGDLVKVRDTVTKEMMDELDGEAGTAEEEANEIAARPTLTFTAYAIQKSYLTDQDGDSDVDAVDAWILVQP